MECNHRDREDAGKHDAKYANYFKTGHNVYEFVLDFGQCYSECEEVEPHTRIITTPAYAKALLRVLQDSIDRYERAFGAIKEQ